MDTTQQLELRRLHAIRGLDRKHRSTLGQFFTPEPVARYMASLLEFPPNAEIHLLDPGAGIGSLTAAAVLAASGQKVKATCYELEPSFQAGLRETVSGLCAVTAELEQSDFITSTILLLTAGEKPNYTHAVLNPPYKKIHTDSLHRQLVRRLGLETSNLYTCFLACTVALCRKGAQVVAIIPRSFMNGPYFRPFRYWLLDRVSLTHIHVFDRRDQAFADDDVLQENVIVRMVVGGQQGPVVVSASTDPSFTDLRRRTCQFAEVVNPGDQECFIHVPTLGGLCSGGLPGVALRELGLDVCTGPVVDFRLRDHLRGQPAADTVPLLYASHFTNGRVAWPGAGRKPNAIVKNAATERWLMQTGCYVILRRFTSKEEKRRVVAYLLNESELPTGLVGFENHLNVIHKDRRGLPPTLAHGLVAYLNSQQVDDYFRTFSGHTQVNATDLRRLRYPSIAELEDLGRGTLA